MNRYFKQIALLLFLVTGFLLPATTDAHAPDQSYLYLRIYKDAIGGRFEMTAKDMNKAVGLNLPDKLSMEIMAPHLKTVQQYLISRSSIKSDLGNYTVRFVEPTVLNLDEMEDFVRFHFELDGVDEVPESLDIYYNVLFDKVPNHRGMLITEYNWKAGIVDNEALFSNVYSGDNTQQSLSLKDASLWKGFVALVKLGVWHIWIGLDHILFIVALILPAVVRRKDHDVPLSLSTANDGWIPVDRFRPAFMYILKIVTFFTIAHSITLALAALQIINLPSWFVESIIALSIALAAFHNIKPIIKSKEWLIAFAFGLFHGFGFASVLGEKGLGGDYMILSLLGFNVGVELGQVLIICMVFPVLYIIRKFKLYPAIIKYGSVLLIFIAIYWFIERAFDIDLQLGAYFWQLVG
ncbi:MAG: HupE/UreJ family protein [Saprospiraceae bacterium]